MSSCLSHPCILTQDIPSLAGSHGLTFSRQQSPVLVRHLEGACSTALGPALPTHRPGSRFSLLLHSPQLKSGYTGDFSKSGP